MITLEQLNYFFPDGIKSDVNGNIFLDAFPGWDWFNNLYAIDKTPFNETKIFLYRNETEYLNWYNMNDEQAFYSIVYEVDYPTVKNWTLMTVDEYLTNHQTTFNADYTDFQPKVITLEELKTFFNDTITVKKDTNSIIFDTIEQAQSFYELSPYIFEDHSITHYCYELTPHLSVDGYYYELSVNTLMGTLSKSTQYNNIEKVDLLVESYIFSFTDLFNNEENKIIIDQEPVTSENLPETNETQGTNMTQAEFDQLVIDVKNELNSAFTALGTEVKTYTDAEIAAVVAEIVRVEGKLDTQIAKQAADVLAQNAKNVDFQSQIDTVVADRLAGDEWASRRVTELQEADAAETLRATNEESRIEGKVDANSAAILALETSLSSSGADLGSEIERVETKFDGVKVATDAAIAQLGSDLASEIATTDAEVVAINERIDNVLSNIDPTSLDSLTEIVAAFQGADSSLVDAINSLSAERSAALDAHVAVYNAKVLEIEFDIATESAARIAEEGRIETKLDGQIAKQASDLSATQTAASNESAARVAEEARIEGKLDAQMTKQADDYANAMTNISNVNAKTNTLFNAINGIKSIDLVASFKSGLYPVAP